MKGPAPGFIFQVKRAPRLWLLFLGVRGEGREGAWGREKQLPWRSEQGVRACLLGLDWQTSCFDSEGGNLLLFPALVVLLISHRAQNMPQQWNKVDMSYWGKRVYPTGWVTHSWAAGMGETPRRDSEQTVRLWVCNKEKKVCGWPNTP